MSRAFNSFFTVLSSYLSAWAMGYGLLVTLFHNLGQKKLLVILLGLSFVAIAGADPCDHYFRCPYEVTGDSRELPFAPQGHIRAGFVWRERSINGNQAALCVRGDRVDTSIFTGSGCIAITRDEASALLMEPQYVPYWDGSALQFRDGLEGRPLETMEAAPQALEMLEAVR